MPTARPGLSRSQVVRTCLVILSPLVDGEIRAAFQGRATPAWLASTLGVGGLFEVLRRWVDGEIDYTTEELVTHCAGFLGSLAAYVLMDPPGARAEPNGAHAANEYEGP
jgi:hypothetical protein